MKLNNLYILIVVALLLSSCGGNATPTSTQEMTVTATATSLPTNTPIPTLTLTPTITPTPMPEVITALNVNKLKITKSAAVGHGLWEMVTTSPDGGYFAAASSSGVIFYDTNSLERVELFDVKDTTVAVAFSPDSSKIAVGKPGPNGKEEELEKRLAIDVWDLKTGKRLNELTGFKDYWETSSLSFSGDGCLLFSYSQTIHNICDNTEIKSGNGWRIKNEFYDQRTYFSPDGQLGLVHSQSGWSVWDVKNNKKLQEIVLRRPSFSPDGKRIMDLADQRIIFLDVSSFKKSIEIKTKAKIDQAKINFDGTYVVTAENDNMLRLYDVTTGELKSEVQSSLHLVVGLSFTIDGKFVTMLDDRGYLKKSEVPTLNVVQEYTDWAVSSPLLVSPNGKQFVMRAHNFSLLSGGHEANPSTLLYVFDTETMKVINQLDDQEPDDPSIGDFAYSPDGRILAAATSKGSVDLWDMSTMQFIKKLEIEPGKVFRPGKDLVGYIREGIAFNANGNLVAALNIIPGYTRVYIWDVATGELVANFNPPLNEHPTLKAEPGVGYLNSIDFDPSDDSKLMFGFPGSYDWKNKKWIADSFRLLPEIHPSGDIVVLSGFGKFEDKFALAYSPQKNRDKYYNCFTNGQDCLFWGQRAGKLKFSADGITIFQYADGKIFIWQVAP